MILGVIGWSIWPIAETNAERRKEQVLKARWHVIETAEDVIEAAEEFCTGMAPEPAGTERRHRAASCCFGQGKGSAMTRLKTTLKAIAVSVLLLRAIGNAINQDWGNPRWSVCRDRRTAFPSIAGRAV